MGSDVVHLFKSLTPVQKAYLASAVLHCSLGIFESMVIVRTRFASTNTVVFYLTSAMVALTQAVIEIDVKPTAPLFLPVFAFITLANIIYLLNCLMFARNKHTSWVCTTFLILFVGVFFSIHARKLPIGNTAEFLHVLLFASTLANNFVPFDSLLAIVTAKDRKCPAQWIPLTTGLLQSTFGGLHRHRMRDTLMAPADALGVAVNLFGLVVELQNACSRPSKVKR
ncbi:unnamed protein product [Calicophoron daubneyi]|uniref:Uncharacterized protein n=1 Tax=Calicophoron daubneyi TaxID=300641 RepID=A0AAV2TX93_CALDB